VFQASHAKLFMTFTIVYEFPSGRYRHGAEKFLNESAEDIKALMKIMQDQL